MTCASCKFSEWFRGNLICTLLDKPVLLRCNHFEPEENMQPAPIDGWTLEGGGNDE